ncbi:hypothetical protein FRC02_003225 [Tulasnella sp. 418]|nr:hypothetical protein FRC02_003225 [Tulasnella sp. 418]
MHAAGVHIGQTDMPLPVARSLLGDKAVIGASVGNVEEAKRAVEEGADYVGIGAVYPTGSKSDAKLLGVRGVGPILTVLGGSTVKSVVIGGVKTVNLLRILHGSVSPTGKHVDGAAVISEIVSSTDPETSARKLRLILDSFLKSGPSTYITSSPDSLALTPAGSNEFVERASKLLDKVKDITPMIHQITNNVVTNQSANATLALGASPIMATTPAEMEDLAKIPGALLINYGTIGDKLGMMEAGKWANFYRKPIVFDPVGAGATQYRKSSASELLNVWQPTVIKGNAGEIGAILGSDEVQSRGVDSVGVGFKNPAEVVMTLARRERKWFFFCFSSSFFGEKLMRLDMTPPHIALHTTCISHRQDASLCSQGFRTTSQMDVLC